MTHNHFKRIRKTLRQEILDYLLSLPLSMDIEVNGTRYKLVHAAPMEAYDHDIRYPNPIHFAFWKRFEADFVLPGDYTLIFGHTPTKYFQDNVPVELWYGGDKICIDCGCGYPEGRLACLRLDDGKVFYSEEQ